jgi:tryptophan synthase beta subunit
MTTAVEQRFGPYGGRFVPETLIAALDELSSAWADAREDEGYQSELADLLRDFVGRPTPRWSTNSSVTTCLRRWSERRAERTTRPGCRTP